MIDNTIYQITRPPFNYRGVVFNARGCANTELTTPQLFNGAYTDDLRHVLKHIQKVLPEGTPLMGIGYSLGSNILVKVCVAMCQHDLILMMWFSILVKKVIKRHLKLQYRLPILLIS